MYVSVPEVQAILPIHQIPIGYYPFKGNLGVPTGQSKFDLVGVSTHDLWIRSSNALRLSYEASTGAGWGNLGSESQLMYK